MDPTTKNESEVALNATIFDPSISSYCFFNLESMSPLYQKDISVSNLGSECNIYLFDPSERKDHLRNFFETKNKVLNATKRDVQCSYVVFGAWNVSTLT